MNNTEEKKLYYKTLTEILYKYMEFTLSFDSAKPYSYLNILPILEEAYETILKDIDALKEVPLNSHEAISHVEEIILKNIADLNIIEQYDIKEGLDIKDISTLSIALYLKRYKNSINNELNTLMDILNSYNTNESKFLLELINMLKNTSLSTSITSTTIDNKLMPYYANLLAISYDEFSTANMYTFIIINVISQINELISRFLENVGLTDVQTRDVQGHIDHFHSHKDELNASYPIDDLSEGLTNLKTNLNTLIGVLQEKNKNASLQLDVKSGN